MNPSETIKAYAYRLSVEISEMQEHAIEAMLQSGEFGVLVIHGYTSVRVGVHTGVPYGDMHELMARNGAEVPEGEWRTSEIIDWDPMRLWAKRGPV